MRSSNKRRTSGEQGKVVCSILAATFLAAAIVVFRSLWIGLPQPQHPLLQHPQVHLPSPKLELKKRVGDGCHHVYLDVGSNIGVQIRKLFEPDKYPGAPVLRSFDKAFGPPAERLASGARRLCAFGFEANPTHWPRLQEVEKAYALKGWRVHFFPSAAGTRDGNTTLWSDNDVRHEEWGASTTVSSRILTRGDRKPTVVPVTDLSRFILEEIHGRSFDAPLPDAPSSARPPHVLMKLDIEGGEFAVLRKLIFSGALCSTISSAFIEEHRWAVPDVQRDNPGMPPTGVSEVKQYVKQAGLTAMFEGVREPSYCPFQILELDDETYLHDSASLSRPRRYSEIEKATLRYNSYSPKETAKSRKSRSRRYSNV